MPTCAQECDYECVDKGHIKVCAFCGNFALNAIRLVERGYSCKECYDDED